VRLLVPPGVFSPPSDAHVLAGVLRAHAAGRDVLDVCTGSGILAVSAALAGARSVTAVDVSRRALLAARVNGLLNGVRVRTRRSDLLDGLGSERFDVIVSNPPYLPALSDAPPQGLERATEAGPDGRLFLDRLIDRAPRHLRPGGVLLLVHSSINGVDASRRRLLAAGLECDVPRRETGPLGPILSARAPLLERRGLLEPGRREEDVVVLRGRWKATPSPPAHMLSPSGRELIEDGSPDR
jgi:release factor glutamine methyltransferase